MVTVQEARQQVSTAKQEIERQSQLAQQKKQELERAKSQLPQVRSQEALRTEKYGTGLQAREFRKKVGSISKDIQSRIGLIKEYEKQLEPAKQQVGKYEQQISSLAQEQQAFETARKLYSKGVPASQTTGDVRKWIREFELGEAAAQEKFLKDVSNIQKSLPSTEKLIYDLNKMEIKGVDVGFKTIPLEEYKTDISSMIRTSDLTTKKEIESSLDKLFLPSVTGLSVKEIQAAQQPAVIKSVLQPSGKNILESALEFQKMTPKERTMAILEGSLEQQKGKLRTEIPKEEFNIFSPIKEKLKEAGITEKVRGAEAKLQSILDINKKPKEGETFYLNKKTGEVSRTLPYRLTPLIKENIVTVKYKEGKFIETESKTGVVDVAGELFLKSGEEFAKRTGGIFKVREGSIFDIKVTEPQIKQAAGEFALFSIFSPAFQTGTYAEEFEVLGKPKKKVGQQLFSQNKFEGISEIEKVSSAIQEVRLSSNTANIERLRKIVGTGDKKAIKQALSLYKEALGKESAQNLIKDFLAQEGLSIPTTQAKTISTQTDYIVQNIPKMKLSSQVSYLTGQVTQEPRMEFNLIESPPQEREQVGVSLKVEQRQKYKPLLKLLDISKTTPIQLQKQPEVQIEKTAQAQRDILGLKQIPKQETKQRKSFRDVLKMQMEEETGVSIFPKKGEARKKVRETAKDLISGFKVLGKRYGEDIEIGEFETLPKARESLKGFLKGTLGASGLITFKGKPLSFREVGLFGPEFRPAKKDMFRIVQERGFRLGTAGEIKEIKLFRKSRGKKQGWI